MQSMQERHYKFLTTCSHEQFEVALDWQGQQACDKSSALYVHWGASPGKDTFIPLTQGRLVPWGSSDLCLLFSRCRIEEAARPESELMGPWVQMHSSPAHFPGPFCLLPALPPPRTSPAPAEFFKECWPEHCSTDAEVALSIFLLTH